MQHKNRHFHPPLFNIFPSSLSHTHSATKCPSPQLMWIIIFCMLICTWGKAIEGLASHITTEIGIESTEVHSLPITHEEFMTKKKNSNCFKVSQTCMMTTYDNYSSVGNSALPVTEVTALLLVHLLLLRWQCLKVAPFLFGNTDFSSFEPSTSV